MRRHWLHILVLMGLALTGGDGDARSLYLATHKLETPEMKMSRAVHHWTRNALADVDVADRISRTVLEESRRYRFDPLFILAVIEHESRFIHTMEGMKGEIGLMQVRPTTAEWIARKYGMPWRGKQMLKNPILNIRIGAAYLFFLRKVFNSPGTLYISAYNMGPRRTRELRSQKIITSQYANSVIQAYQRIQSEFVVKNDSLKR